MKAQSVSTYGTSLALRMLAAKDQALLAKAQQEAHTGMVFDTGLALGARTGQSVSLRKEFDRLGVLTDMNKLVAERMNASQAAMTGMVEKAQDFLASLTGASTTPEGRGVIVASAKNAMETVGSLLNTSFNGEYVFSGVNTDVQPVVDYFDPQSGARGALQQAFVDYFGFPVTSPQVASINGNQLDAFLGGVFADQFEDAEWGANWSDASNGLVKSRISPTETTETSVSANETGFCKAMMAFSMVVEFADIGLNEAAFFQLTTKALGVTTQAISGIATSQGTLGMAQMRTKDANMRLSIQKNILNNAVLDLEAIDPYEAATRVNNLMTQIETSYALTVRLQNMSLLNYLR